MPIRVPRWQQINEISIKTDGRDCCGGITVRKILISVVGNPGQVVVRPFRLIPMTGRLFPTVRGRSDLLQYIGTIVRLNQKTATIACQESEWRVSYSLLHRIVEV